MRVSALPCLHQKITLTGPSVDEEEPAEPEAAPAPEESQNARPALQQPSRAAIDDEEAIKRRQARFGAEPAPAKKPAATAVRQAGVAKRVGNAFAQQSGTFNQLAGLARGQGFVGHRGRGVGSFRGRGGRGALMHNRPIGGPFRPQEPSIRAPRPPSHPPPAVMGGLQASVQAGLQPDMMGQAFANIKSNSAMQKHALHDSESRTVGKGAQVHSTPFTPTAAPFRPRMPSVQHTARPSFSVGAAQTRMQAAAQVAKASTWVRSEAPAQQASRFANGAHQTGEHTVTAVLCMT